MQIGALTTHAEIERSADIAKHLPLLAQAAPHIAHAAIRNAGTLGGSIATGGSGCRMAGVLRRARCRVRHGRQERQPAREGAGVFQGRLFHRSAPRRNADAASKSRCRGATYRSAFVELARRRGDYAIVGVAALAKNTDGALSDVRLAYFGAGETPVLAQSAMAAIGRQAGIRRGDGSRGGARARLEPGPDLYSSAATKLHLARVLTGRALTALAA